jgi:hypothetical protein
MNPEFARVLSAQASDRRGLFVDAARSLGTSERYIEKDFWVCWTLDALFNGLRASGVPRLLFKGGTSLSKAFGLINRFSEDIDITVFRQDLGAPATIEELEKLSSKKRAARLDAIRDACRSYIGGPLMANLGSLLTRAVTGVGLSPESVQVEMDPDDPDGQTISLRYPSVIDTGDAYVRPSVRIECGAKSALDPHQSIVVKPYVADVLPYSSFTIGNVVTVDARRTFWDKVVILHGTRRWFENKGDLRQKGERVSRHYYDVHQMFSSAIGQTAAQDLDLGRDCARHARMFFDRAPFDLAAAVDGRFVLRPTEGMIGPLRRDYDNMAGMIFGPVPQFDAVMESIGALEQRINEARRVGPPG